MRTSSSLPRLNLALAIAAGAALAAGATSPLLAIPALCTPNATTLCFDQAPGDGRFSATLTYNTTLGGGQSGVAHALPLAPVGVTRGGLFWIFGADNPELMVKVIDGCGSNGHFWVYYSAGTNVGFTLTVTDLLYPTHIWTHTNPDLSVAQSVADIQAFTCDGSEPPPPGPGDGPWILTTRPGAFFTPSELTPYFQIDIPVDAAEIFYKVVVEVEIDMNGYYAGEPGGKHNVFTIWRGDTFSRNLFGEVGLYGPDVNELELVSNADSSQREYRSIFQFLDPTAVYSFLFTYDLSNEKTKVNVYEGSVVGENRVLTMTGETTAHYPIVPAGTGFHVGFGSELGDGIGGNQVPTVGWVYKNLKVYLERPVD